MRRRLQPSPRELKRSKADQRRCSQAKILLPGPAASLAAAAQLLKQLTVTAMIGLPAGACSQQQQAIQPSVVDNNYRLPDQKQGPLQQQQQLLPVTVTMTCYMQHMLSSRSFYLASSSVKPVLWSLTKPPAEVYPLPQRTNGNQLLGQTCCVLLTGRPARTVP